MEVIDKIQCVLSGHTVATTLPIFLLRAVTSYYGSRGIRICTVCKPVIYSGLAGRYWITVWCGDTVLGSQGGRDMQVTSSGQCFLRPSSSVNLYE